MPLLTDVHHVEPSPFSALYLAGRRRLPKVRVFLDFLIERFVGAPWRINVTKTYDVTTGKPHQIE